LADFGYPYSSPFRSFDFLPFLPISNYFEVDTTFDPSNIIYNHQEVSLWKIRGTTQLEITSSSEKIHSKRHILTDFWFVFHGNF